MKIETIVEDNDGAVVSVNLTHRELVALAELGLTAILERDAAKAIVPNLEERLSAAEQEVQRLNATLAASERVNDALTGDVAGLTKRLDSVNKTKDAEIERLRAALGKADACIVVGAKDQARAVIRAALAQGGENG